MQSPRESTTPSSEVKQEQPTPLVNTMFMLVLTQEKLLQLAPAM